MVCVLSADAGRDEGHHVFKGTFVRRMPSMSALWFGTDPLILACMGAIVARRTRQDAFVSLSLSAVTRSLHKF